MEKYFVSVKRIIEGGVSVQANSKEEAIKIVEQGLEDGTIEIDDDNQYYNDWEIEKV